MMVEATPTQSSASTFPGGATAAGDANAEERPLRLSVVVVSFNAPALLERCLLSLHRQTVRDGVEVVIVRSGEQTEEIEALQRRYREARWVCDREPRSVPQLRSCGIAESRGEIVAFLEDDCIADDLWCACLLSAHRGDDVAVGGAVEPGNYTKPVDWAVYFFEYARFMRPLPAGEARALPGTNVSYKRAALLRLIANAENAAHALGAEGFYEYLVHAAVRGTGAPLRLTPDLVVYNVNSWRLTEVVKTQFHYGRVFAALRVAGLPGLRRLGYLALAIVLPVLQIARIGREVISRRRYIVKAGAALPWIAVLALSWSIGEFVGYLAESGRRVPGGEAARLDNAERPNGAGSAPR